MSARRALDERGVVDSVGIRVSPPSPVVAPALVIRKDGFAFSAWVYKRRNLIQNFFNQIKHVRGLATRYDCSPDNFLRMLLGARKAVQQGMVALEMSLRGLLRNFGLTVGAISRRRFEMRIRDLVEGNAMLEAAAAPMLRARAALRDELADLERQVRLLAKEDPVCRLLMSMPWVGAVVALTFKSAINDPGSLPIFSPGRAMGRSYADAAAVRRARCLRRRHARRRRRPSARAPPSRHGDVEPWTRVMAAGMGDGDRETPRNKTCDGRAVPPDWRRPAPHVDRWRRLPGCGRSRAVRRRLIALNGKELRR